MLINCPECDNRISDKAFSCPHCGFPIAQTVNSTLNGLNARQTASTGSRKVVKKNHYVPRRLPNGFGSIRHLSGNRRKPFAAHPPVTEYRDNGKDKSATPIVPKAIGYYETYEEAYDALRAWQKNPYDTDKRQSTFEDVYKQWCIEKFEKSPKETSASTKAIYRSAFNNCKQLHSRAFMELKTEDFQNVLNMSDKGYSTVQNILGLFKQMSKYALKYDIIEKDYACLCYCPKEDDRERGEPFSEEAIKILWKNKSDPAVQTILIMIYSGMRITEVKTCEIKGSYFVGGVKTRASKNRYIPIHPKIANLSDGIELLRGISTETYRNAYFYKALARLGIETSANGTKHTPHDCRHTFSWLADKYKLDDVSKHLIMGHALKGDTEETVYSHRTLEQLTKEMSKIKTP